MHQKDIENLLRLYELDDPKKSLGQNFLLNEFVLYDIIEYADLDKNDVVLEIGPGLGVLTTLLYKEVKKLYLVELDDKLIEYLKLQFFNAKNIEYIHSNVLDLDLDTLLQDQKYKIVANIPYNISSNLLDKIVQLDNKPERMVLLLQKEFAQRISAQASGDVSFLTVYLQFYYNIIYKKRVDKKDFYPIPKVDSAIVLFERTNKYEELLKKYNLKKEDLFRLIKIGFSARRKKLYNNLNNALIFNIEEIKKYLEDIGQREDARPQDLSLEDWIILLKNMQGK